MITEDFCSYEVAKLLKEKGFPFMCNVGSLLVDKQGNIKLHSTFAPITRVNEDDDNTPCVTQALARKWLRETHDVHVSVTKSFLINDMDDKTYLAHVSTKECHTSYNAWQEYHKTYEEAVEAALMFSLTELI